MLGLQHFCFFSIPSLIWISFSNSRILNHISRTDAQFFNRKLRWINRSIQRTVNEYDLSKRSPITIMVPIAIFIRSPNTFCLSPANLAFCFQRYIFSIMASTQSSLIQIKLKPIDTVFLVEFKNDMVLVFCDYPS